MLFQLHPHQVPKMLGIGGGTKQTNLKDQGTPRCTMRPSSKLHGPFAAFC